MVRKCRALQYDVALQLLFNRTTLPVLFLRRCAPRGLIIGKPDYRSQFLLDRTVDPGPGHYSQRTLRFARALIGEHWKEPPARMSIRIPAAVSDDAQRSIREHGLTIGAFVLINVSAGARDRSIGPTLAAGIAERLRKAGVAVALSGEPSDWGLVDEVCRKTGAVMLTANSLVEAIALYQYPEAVITPDTAMLHVASATGRPVVALFGERGDPEGWGPQSVHQRTILADRGTTVTTGIRAEQVVESALELLRLVRT